LATVSGSQALSGIGRILGILEFVELLGLAVVVLEAVRIGVASERIEDLRLIVLARLPGRAFGICRCHRLLSGGETER